MNYGYHFANIDNAKIAHIVTSRHNISLNHGNREESLSNRQKICQDIGIYADDLVVGQQVHGDQIAIVTAEDRGRGASDHSQAIAGVDALVTTHPSLPMMALAADCQLIGLIDTAKQIIAVVHAGWRSTVQNIVAKTVMTMQQQFQSSPEDIAAYFSPAIGVCCYEVGAEVAEQIGQNHCEIRGAKIYANIDKANEQQLRDLGVTKITKAGICTYCNRDYPSYRRDAEKAGRFALIMMLRDSS